jgi:hypothetical protein
MRSFLKHPGRLAVVAVIAAVGLAALASAPRIGRGRAASRLMADQALTASAPASVGADFSLGRPMLGAVEEKQAATRLRQAPATPTLPSASQTVSTGMVIRNGDVSVEVDSIEIAVATLRQLASSLGGYVGNVSTQSGERQVRSATLEVKVPAARFDDAMSGMAPLGKVERSTAIAEDVGEEFVDITARVANAKRLEARLVALLAQRTGKLEDVLAVERELARVREEIERYEGRLRFLSSRVATSAIVATVHEKLPVIAGQPGTNVLANAFVNMWRNFVRFVAAGIEFLGVLVPLLALAWLGWLGLKRWNRSHPASTAS